MMERKGSCGSCGWCCQFLMVQRTTVPVHLVNEDITKFYDLRNGIKGGDGKIRFTGHLFVPCEWHDNVNKRCKDYKNRPEVCKHFPSTPDQIEGTPCYFWFEENGECRGGLNSPHPTPPRFGD